MCEMLAGRADSVMAAHARCRDPEMIEEHGKPGGRQMAGVAFLLCRWMVGRLADALNVVVARRAAAEDRVMIHLSERQPGRRSVTVFAEIGREDVIGRFGRRANAAADGVTAHTIEWCPLEYTTDMAGLTIRCDVRAFERETRREVIEVGVESGLSPAQGWH